MHPEVEEANRADGAGETFSPWLALQRATDKKRADLLADIVGHPVGAPSVEELDYMNPPLSDDAIRRHLRRLVDVRVVKELEYEEGDPHRVRDYPRKFYTLTSEARDLFDKNGLFPKAAWQRQYQSVQKTPRIEELEAMPRPE